MRKHFLGATRLCALGTAIATILCASHNASASSLLLVSANGGHAVYAYNGTSTSVWGTSPNGGFAPTGIAQAPNGDVYVCDYGTNHIVKFPKTGGLGTEIIPSGGGLGNGEGMAFGPDGKLYLANYSGGFNGSVVRYVVGPGNSLTLDATFYGVSVIDPDSELEVGQPGGRTGLVFNGNDLYVTDYTDNKILRYNNVPSLAGGAILADVVLDNSNNGIFHAHGITFDSGNLLVAQTGLGVITSYNLASPGVGTNIESGSAPVHILRSPDDNRLFATYAGSGTLVRYDANGTNPTTVGSGLATAHFMSFINPSLPEPGTGLLVICGIAGAALNRRRRC